MCLLCLQDCLMATDSISSHPHKFKLCTDKVQESQRSLPGAWTIGTEVIYRIPNHTGTVAFVYRTHTARFLELVMKHSFLLLLKLSKLASQISHLSVTVAKLDLRVFLMSPCITNVSPVAGKSTVDKVDCLVSFIVWLEFPLISVSFSL